MSRTNRRRHTPGAGTPAAQDIATLHARVKALKLPGTPLKLLQRARKALAAYIQSAAKHGLPFDELATRLSDGRGAITVYQAEVADARATGADPQTGAACRSGCAYCCILSGDDGGTITATEAAQLYTALLPLQGHPDGRQWHPKACPALNPMTLTCRAYDARPNICRSFHSTDAQACKANSEGAAVEGPRLEGAHATYLAALGLSRAALNSQVETPTFSMAAIAAAAIDGLSPKDTLNLSQHDKHALVAERRRTGQAWRDADKTRRF
ncbi:MAG: YkgJ family cysteine cluster protein [Pseudomonadota bacterium]